MLNLTKIFHFEMAHAIYGYPGVCKNIHGHSYELHVSVSSPDAYKDYIPAPGFVIDFKEIKNLVNAAIIDKVDHKLLLSQAYLHEHPSFLLQENLITFPAEPTAENILLFIQQTLAKKLPDNVKLVQLKLYETKDSYAEWTNGNTLSGFKIVALS